MNRKLRVLIVEDQSYSAAHLARAFAKQEFEFIWHQNADEASEALTVFRADVIVMEQRIPGMTAEDFIKQSKHKFPKATVLRRSRLIRLTPARLLKYS